MRQDRSYRLTVRGAAPRRDGHPDVRAVGAGLGLGVRVHAHQPLHPAYAGLMDGLHRICFVEPWDEQAMAGLLAMPTGLALALILTYVINRRSFGWTLQFQVNPALFGQALALAVVAALLAGVYPALRLGRMLAAEALRGE